MKRTLVITDLTRMSGGHVCVAGYAEDVTAVRLASPRLPEASLSRDGQLLVFPGALIDCELWRHIPAPPHTEDYTFEPRYLNLLRRLAQPEWESWLERTRFDNVAALFEQPILDDLGYYLMDGHGPRSLGTIRPRDIAG